MSDFIVSMCVHAGAGIKFVKKKKNTSYDDLNRIQFLSGGFVFLSRLFFNFLTQETYIVIF